WGGGALNLLDCGRLQAGSLSLAAAVGSGGVLNIGAAAGDAAAGAGGLDTAEVIFGAGAGTLVFNHTGTAYDFGAGISGTGLVSVLAGNTTLGGDSSGFAGTTTVEGGLLRVDGTL